MAEYSFKHKRLPKKVTGLNTGLGVTECWIALFLENERRHRAGGQPKPRTNPEITRFMINEFPRKNSEIYRKVNKVRAAYNSGKMYRGQGKPANIYKSYRYDSKGNRVDPRYFDPETD
jgi:hypothetical protein